MGFHFVNRLSGPANPVVREYEADSTGVERGDPVAFDGSEKLTVASSDDDVIGVALDAGGDIDDPQVLTSPDAIFEVEYVGSGKESLDEDDIGSDFDFDSSDSSQIDLDATDNGDVTIVGFDNDNDIAYVTLNKHLLA